VNTSQAAQTLPASLGTADEVLSVAEAMDTQYLLRRSLSEPNADVAQRQHLVDALFGDRLSKPTLELLHDAAGDDWPSSDALAYGIRDAAVTFGWRSAVDDQSVETARTQVLALIAAVTTNLAVSTALGDLSRDVADRQGLALSLVKGASGVVGLLTRSALTDGRGVFAANLSDYLDALAALRGHQRAAVVSAVALTPAQTKTLITQLSRIFGSPIDLEPSVDPDVIGGIRVDVGGDVIDGSIKARLDAARQAMSQITLKKDEEND